MPGYYFVGHLRVPVLTNLHFGQLSMLLPTDIFCIEGSKVEGSPLPRSMFGMPRCRERTQTLFRNLGSDLHQRHSRGFQISARLISALNNFIHKT